MRNSSGGHPIPLKMPLDRAAFLRDYWQREPLLMRNALPPDAFPLSPHELAGLACEAEVESRLVIERPGQDWTLEHGPFDERRFASLPASNWTLLVQDVDKYLGDVADLLDPFDFVPAWRVDDIMISYATDGGGVGPHRDDYDVFLMQAQGRRRWRIGTRPHGDDDLLPDQPLRLLADFDVVEDWVLEPGDVLYLPPGVAHWGTAVGECMTYSLGFRAPRTRELLSDWLQHLAERAPAAPLVDPSEGERTPGALSPGLIESARTLCQRLPEASAGDFSEWLGCFLTEPKPQFQIEPPQEPWTTRRLADWLAQGGCLTRHPWARLCWARTDRGRIALFCNGSQRVFDETWLVELDHVCRHRRIADGQASGLTGEHWMPLLLELVNAGILEPMDAPCHSA
jgi:50S ribosomal protein L16 3-hydroxylase